MKPIKIALVAALIGISTAALAVDPDADAGRQQRMDDALQNYRDRTPDGNADRNPSPGPFARAEESAKHGVRRAGAAIKHGAQTVGHAIGTGAEKTGDAIRHTGEKLQGASTPKP